MSRFARAESDQCRFGAQGSTAPQSRMSSDHCPRRFSRFMARPKKKASQSRVVKNAGVVDDDACHRGQRSYRRSSSACRVSPLGIPLGPTTTVICPKSTVTSRRDRYPSTWRDRMSMTGQ